MNEEEKEVFKRVKEEFEINGLGCKNFECSGNDMYILLKLIEKQVGNIQRLQELLDLSDAKKCELERQIKIKDKYCELIRDIGYDHDGYGNVESLKGLIDELVGFATKAINNDDKSTIFHCYHKGKTYKQNILNENLGELKK